MKGARKKKKVFGRLVQRLPSPNLFGMQKSTVPLGIMVRHEPVIQKQMCKIKESKHAPPPHITISQKQNVAIIRIKAFPVNVTMSSRKHQSNVEFEPKIKRSQDSCHVLNAPLPGGAGFLFCDHFSYRRMREPVSKPPLQRWNLKRIMVCQVPLSWTEVAVLSFPGSTVVSKGCGSWQAKGAYGNVN